MSEAVRCRICQVKGRGAWGGGGHNSFPLFVIGRAGQGTALHICTFMATGWLEIHLETGWHRLALRGLKGATLQVTDPAAQRQRESPESSGAPASTPPGKSALEGRGPSLPSVGAGTSLLHFRFSPHGVSRVFGAQGRLHSNNSTLLLLMMIITVATGPELATLPGFAPRRSCSVLLPERSSPSHSLSL